MRRAMIVTGLWATTALAGVQFLADRSWAEPSFPGVWQQQYPSSQSMNNLPAPCQMCHLQANGGNNFNPYGNALKAQIGKGLTIQQALTAVEGLNSDNDPTGSTNLQEIAANTQPGWT